MAIISFALTAPQFSSGAKTVTRRDWSERYYQQWLKWYDAGKRRHQGYDKSPRNGGKYIGDFYLTHRPYKQRIAEMSPNEFVAEGVFPDIDTPEQFAKLVDKRVDDEMIVIRFAKMGIGESPKRDLSVEYELFSTAVDLWSKFSDFGHGDVMARIFALSAIKMFPDAVGNEDALLDLADAYKKSHSLTDQFYFCAYLNNIRPKRYPWKFDFVELGNNPIKPYDFSLHKSYAYNIVRAAYIHQRGEKPLLSQGDVACMEYPWERNVSRAVVCGVDSNFNKYTIQHIECEDHDRHFSYNTMNIELVEKYLVEVNNVKVIRK